jgi:HEAT repeat protein
LGDKRDVKPLLSLLDREIDVASRAGIVNALACLGHRRGHQELGQNLDSADPGVRTMAAEFAGHSRAIEHRAKLVELLDDAKLDTRVRAAQSLIALSLPAAKGEAGE